MKRIMLMLIAVIIAVSALADTPYLPMYELGKKWVYEMCNYDYPSDEEVLLVEAVAKEWQSNGLNYFVLDNEIVKEDPSTSKPVPDYISNYIDYEKDNCVYQAKCTCLLGHYGYQIVECNNDDSRHITLDGDRYCIYKVYDFNLHPGDVIEECFEVIDEGIIESHGYRRRTLKLMTIDDRLENKHLDNTFLWVEGIGTLHREVHSLEFIESQYHPADDSYPNIFLYEAFQMLDRHCLLQRFKECYLNDELIFTAEDFDKFVSTADVEEVNAESSLPFIPGVYNLQGIKVGDTTDGLPAGLYIVNGKKTFVN